jgi:hypothetical protein
MCTRLFSRYVLGRRLDRREDHRNIDMVVTRTERR